MLKVFDLENINFDELLVTALDDPQAIGETQGVSRHQFRRLADRLPAILQERSRSRRPAVDLADVIAFYNKAAADLPDHTKLKGLKLPGASVVLDRKGNRFAEVFEENQRRVWVVLADIPEHVQNAFVAAEDKRFYQHKGIDEHGLIRAFIGNLAQSGRPQGGSTITQQVVKNLLVGRRPHLRAQDPGDDRRRAGRVAPSRKGEILELYLNSVYLGRSAWGIELAATRLFRQTAECADRRRRRLPRRPDQGAELLQSRPASRSGLASGSPTC